MRLQILGRAVAVAGLFAAAACDNNTAPPSPDLGAAVDQGGDTTCELTLAAVTPSTQNIQVGNRADLAVRLSDCLSAPVLAREVSFTVKGNAQGSTLSAATASTDDSGVAKLTISAGPQPASFQVEATHAALAPVLFQVNVTAKPLGNIVVQPSYAGKKTFDGLQALLYADQSCASFDPFALPKSMQTSLPATSLASQLELKDLLEGSYAVVVTAKKSGELLGWGCAASVAVEAAKTTKVTVTINDLPVVYNGTYLLDNHFDLTGLLPPSVAGPVKLLDEATDDHQLENDDNVKGNGQYGLNPAAFLLDFVYREFCRWECLAAEDFDTCSQNNHPKGDLSALYLENFSTWSGAQPTLWGLCGALDFPVGATGWTHTYVNEQVQNQITTRVPTAAQNFLQMVGDLAATFTKMHILSKLSLTPTSHTGFNFTHVLETLVLTVHDLSGTALTKQVKLVDAGLANLSYSGSTSSVDDLLQIPKHSFQLSFGKLLQYLYLNVVLPALGYSSTAQMFAAWIDCTSVGNWLYEKISTELPIFSASFYEGFCDLGLQAAGAYVEAAIAASVSTAAQIELEGSCGPGTLGERRLVLSLVNGAWTGAVTEGSFSAPLTGSFTGTRQ